MEGNLAVGAAGAGEGKHGGEAAVEVYVGDQEQWLFAFDMNDLEQRRDGFFVEHDLTVSSQSGRRAGVAAVAQMRRIDCAMVLRWALPMSSTGRCVGFSDLWVEPDSSVT